MNLKKALNKKALNKFAQSEKIAPSPSEDGDPRSLLPTEPTSECPWTCSQLEETRYDFFDKEVINTLWWLHQTPGGDPDQFVCNIDMFDYDRDGEIGVPDVVYVIDHWGEPWYPACTLDNS